MMISPMACEGTSASKRALISSMTSEMSRSMRSASTGRLSVALRMPEAILVAANKVGI